MKPPPEVAERIAAIPLGTSTGSADHKNYIVHRQAFNNGRSTKIVAEERGGKDYISLNFYQLKSGARLFPCEMPAAKVIRFLQDFKLDVTAHD